MSDKQHGCWDCLWAYRYSHRSIVDTRLTCCADWAMQNVLRLPDVPRAHLCQEWHAKGKEAQQ